LATAFAPGAIVANVARQFEVSTSLIYKWQTLACEPTAAFAPAVMVPEPAAAAPPDTTAIMVELSNGAVEDQFARLGCVGDRGPAGVAMIPIASGVRNLDRDGSHRYASRNARAGFASAGRSGTRSVRR
jgi:hypothetical protein